MELGGGGPTRLEFSMGGHMQLVVIRIPRQIDQTSGGELFVQKESLRVGTLI